MLVLEGVINEIIFRNDNNGYTVANLETDDGPITIVGYAAIIGLDQMVELEGEMVYHDKFGEQFSFSTIKAVQPSTLKGIENYLASGLLPYVGPKTAKNIVEKFGLDSLDIIQYNPERLKEIPGIGQKKFEKIAEAYEEQRELRDIMVYLQQYDISVNIGLRIYKRYGKESIKMISENPYRLAEEVYGIGFKTADNIAKNMGIESDSPYRIEAGLKYALMSAAGEGHCYLPKYLLIKRTLELLNVEEKLIEDSVSQLLFRDNFYLVEDPNGPLVYYGPYHIAENNVARKIVELSRADFEDFDLDMDKMLARIEKENEIEFGKKQSLAIRESIDNGFMIITGGPGTGKTTTINAILDIYEGLDLKVALAAPTGRAAKRMTETTGRDSKTIHRLLEFSYFEEDMAFNKGEDSPIEADLIIIDEASMIDILLMNSLLKAINPGTRLILVGDIDQLPSVGPGNVLKDIIASSAVRVVVLDEIFRQAEESMIIVNAHKINKGEKPIFNKEGKDFFFLEERDSSSALATLIELNKERLPKFYQLDPIQDIQVLTAMRKGELGTKSLNKRLQAALNPPAKNKKEKAMGDEIFRVADKVMQIKNNYNIEWRISRYGMELDRGLGVFNGDFGYIKDIDDLARTLTVIFDDEKEVTYDFNNLDELQLAYATTVHKAQGSEFPVVVMPIHWGPPMLLNRNLIYTAISRARQLVVLVGQERFMHMMIDNNRIAERYSSLDKKIQNFLSSFY